MTFYNEKLIDMQKTTPWYPSKQIYNQLNICPFVYYGSTGSQDVRVLQIGFLKYFRDVWQTCYKNY